MSDPKYVPMRVPNGSEIVDVLDDPDQLSKAKAKGYAPVREIVKGEQREFVVDDPDQLTKAQAAGWSLVQPIASAPAPTTLADVQGQIAQGTDPHSLAIKEAQATGSMVPLVSPAEVEAQKAKEAEARAWQAEQEKFGNADNQRLAAEEAIVRGASLGSDIVNVTAQTIGEYADRTFGKDTDLPYRPIGEVWDSQKRAVQKRAEHNPKTALIGEVGGAIINPLGRLGGGVATGLAGQAGAAQTLPFMTRLLTNGSQEGATAGQFIMSKAAQYTPEVASKLGAKALKATATASGVLGRGIVQGTGTAVESAIYAASSELNQSFLKGDYDGLAERMWASAETSGSFGAAVGGGLGLISGTVPLLRSAPKVVDSVQLPAPKYLEADDLAAIRAGTMDADELARSLDMPVPEGHKAVVDGGQLSIVPSKRPSPRELLVHDAEYPLESSKIEVKNPGYKRWITPEKLPEVQEEVTTALKPAIDKFLMGTTDLGEELTRAQKKRWLNVYDTPYPTQESGPELVKRLRNELGMSDAQLDELLNHPDTVGGKSKKTIKALKEQLNKLDEHYFPTAETKAGKAGDAVEESYVVRDSEVQEVGSDPWGLVGDTDLPPIPKAPKVPLDFAETLPDTSLNLPPLSPNFGGGAPKLSLPGTSVPQLVGTRPTVGQIFAYLDDAKKYVGQASTKRNPQLNRSLRAIYDDRIRPYLENGDKWLAPEITQGQREVNIAWATDLTNQRNQVYKGMLRKGNTPQAKDAFEVYQVVDPDALKALVKKVGTSIADEDEKFVKEALRAKLKSLETRAKTWGASERQIAQIDELRESLNQIERGFSTAGVAQKMSKVNPTIKGIQLPSMTNAIGVGGALGIGSVAASLGSAGWVSAAGVAGLAGAKLVASAAQKRALNSYRKMLAGQADIGYIAATAATAKKVVDAGKAVGRTARTAAGRSPVVGSSDLATKGAVVVASRAEDIRLEVESFIQDILPEKILEWSGDLGEQLTEASVRHNQAKAEFLRSKLPTAQTVLGPKPQKLDPETAESVARYLDAVKDPMSALERVAEGVAEPEDLETLEVVYPSLLQDFRGKTLQILKTEPEGSLDYEDEVRLSLILNAPVSEAMDPGFQMFLNQASGIEIAGAEATPEQAPPARTKVNSSPYDADQVYASRSDQLQGQLGSR